MMVRAVGRDIDDFSLLAEIIGLNSAEEALHICAESEASMGHEHALLIGTSRP